MTSDQARTRELNIRGGRYSSIPMCMVKYDLQLDRKTISLFPNKINPPDHVNKVIVGPCCQTGSSFCKEMYWKRAPHGLSTQDPMSFFCSSLFYRRTYSRTPRRGRPARLRASSVVVWSLYLATMTTRPGARPRRRQATRPFLTRRSWR
jgi:hypothetical protein